MAEDRELVFDEDDVAEQPEPREGIEDLKRLTPRAVSQAVLSATDWTTETIISQINKKNIQLDPSFQRRDAWRAQRKSRFIESLVLGLPVPQLVLAESKERKGSYIVIDGKQRLLSIRQFAAETNDAVFSRLKLTGLTVRPDLNRLSLNDFRRDPERFDDLTAFENQPIRTVVIKNWPNEDFLYHVFLRLNTGSVPLSPQELRQALHPGPFVSFADVRSSESPALRQLLRLTEPDFRMRDTELLVRYYAFTLFLPDYNGELKDFLDMTCARLNSDWDQDPSRITAHADTFESAYDAARLVFGERNVFRKWTGKSYERPLNRAIFDVMMYAFSEASVRRRITEDASVARRIEDTFKLLCETNADFLASIERTTKSLDATWTRLSVWCKSLNDQIGANLAVPRLVAGRIV